MKIEHLVLCVLNWANFESYQTKAELVSELLFLFKLIIADLSLRMGAFICVQFNGPLVVTFGRCRQKAVSYFVLAFGATSFTESDRLG